MSNFSRTDDFTSLEDVLTNNGQINSTNAVNGTNCYIPYSYPNVFNNWFTIKKVNNGFIVNNNGQDHVYTDIDELLKFVKVTFKDKKENNK